MSNIKGIEGMVCYNALASGAANVISKRIELNKINVFPVADGDTGSNLSATMTGILEYMKPSHDISVVLDTAAEGALMSARGNSGIIFAQFLYGFREEILDKHQLEYRELAPMLKKALNKVYSVILNPVEGTILTVMRAWVEAIERHIESEANIARFSDIILDDSLRALEKTPEQLPILKEKGVVDSGAKGFYHFLEGIARYLKTGEAPVVKEDSADSFVIMDVSHSHEELSEMRYCCEAVIQNSSLSLEQLKHRLEAQGDSLIVAGGQDKMRVHIHSNHPEDLFTKLAQAGRLSGIKADDMHLQQAVVEGPVSRVAIVTDSIADLPEGFAFEHQVFVLPLQLEVDGVAHVDRVSLSTKGFYAVNQGLKEQPKSSLPAIKQVDNLFGFLASHYRQVLVLSVSDKLSGTYQLLESKARQHSREGFKVAVVNTKLNSGAQGLLVKRAVAYAKEGLDLEAIKTAIEALVPHTRILVAVDTVKYLARSGRVSRRAAKVAELLGLKPIMTLDEEGNGKAYGGTLSHKALMNKLVKEVEKDQKTYGIENCCIVHAACEQRALDLKVRLEETLGISVDFISEISPVVGATAGEGAVAVAYVKARNGEHHK